MSKYSIILPVRNGGHYVKDCVASILAQTCTDFNLLVLDNASTDGTTQWLQSLTDPRVVLYPSDRSLGIEENWGRIVSLPKNEYITLIGHDDLLDASYLSVMDKLMERYPDASLWQSHFRFIDSEGKEIKSCKPMQERYSPNEFLRTLLANEIDIMGTGFLMRARDYDAIGGIPPYPNLLFADFEMVVRLTNKSYFAVAKETAFSFRLHQSTTTVSPDTKMQQAFDRLIHYLEDLHAHDTRLAPAIEEMAPAFVTAYAKGLSHRLLRTPVKNRGGLSVSAFLDRCREYVHRLSPKSTVDPAAPPSIRLAKLLDSSALGRSLFLAVKKIYSKPVLK